MKYLLIILLATVLLGCAPGGKSNEETIQTPPSTAVLTRQIAPGNEQCPNGGIQIEIGIDDNFNSTLDSDEVDKIEIVCHGRDGKDSENISSSNQTQNLTVADVNQLIKDAIADIPQLKSDTSATSTPGLSSLILTSTEPSGSNCGSGGVKIQAGLDSNKNNTLDLSEITNTSYLCSIETRTTVPQAPVPISAKTFSGYGVGVTSTFGLTEGLWKFDITINQSSRDNIVAYLRHTTSTNTELLVNEIGTTWSGSQTEYIRASEIGNYVIDIKYGNNNTNWIITVTPL